MTKEPFTISLRPGLMIVAAVIESAEDLSDFERAYHLARESFVSVILEPLAMADRAQSQGTDHA